MCLQRGPGQDNRFLSGTGFPAQEVLLYRHSPRKRTAGADGDAAADEGKRGGERDEPRAGAGLDGGAGDRGGGEAVDEQQVPGLLPGQCGRLAAQLAAGTADGCLQMKERDFDLSSLAMQPCYFPGGEFLMVQQRGQDPHRGGLAAALRAWARHAGTPLIDLARSVVR